MNDTAFENRFDVAIIGGGPAGLAAAVVLARARRRVVVVDSGEQRNKRAAGVHGYLGCDGVPPAQLIESGRLELARYGGTLVLDTVDRAIASPGQGFAVTLADGRQLTSRRLLIASGLTDELPAVPGLADRFGRDVLHCPYCHGWEVRDRAIAVLGTGPWSVHLAQLLRQWSADVVLLLGTASPPDGEQATGLDARGIRVERTAVVGVECGGTEADDRLTGVRLADGRIVACEALFCSPRMTARTDGLADLGLTVTQDGRGFGAAVATDDAGRTGVPGVWAAGNVRNVQAQVSTAAADGATVAAAINADLVAEDVRRAVAHRRRHRSEGQPVTEPPEHHLIAQQGGVNPDHHHGNEPVDVEDLYTQEFWDERYASTDRVWSGKPNQRLVEQVGGLTPGTALDVACGEGADAIWLARQGWQVTAVDVSEVALRRAATHAATAAAAVADAIIWERVDAKEWQPPAGAFDLVSAQFLHLPPDRLPDLFERLHRALRPDGTLLFVGHHPDDLETTIGRPRHADLLLTAEHLAGLLDPEHWQVVLAQAQQREAVDPEGRPVTIADSVLRAVRRPR